MVLAGVVNVMVKAMVKAMIKVQVFSTARTYRPTSRTAPWFEWGRSRTNQHSSSLPHSMVRHRVADRLVGRGTARAYLAENGVGLNTERFVWRDARFVGWIHKNFKLLGEQNSKSTSASDCR